MVNAYYKNSLKEYKKLCTFHTFVARGPRTYAFPILFFLFSIAFFVMGFLSDNSLLFVAAVVLFLAAFLLPLFNLWFQNGKVEKNVRKNPRYEKTEQFFEFDKTKFHLRICVGGQVEEYDIPYDRVLRIYERRDNFYLYIGGAQVLILNKSGVEAGKVDELAELFRAAGDRFREKKKFRGAETRERG